MSLFRLLVVIAALTSAAAPMPAAIDVPPPHAALPVPDTRKMIALTFDDVPRAPGAFFTVDERTSRLIAELRTLGVPQVAFFVNPGRIRPGDGAAERIAATRVSIRCTDSTRNVSWVIRSESAWTSMVAARSERASAPSARAQPG